MRTTLRLTVTPLALAAVTLAACGGNRDAQATADSAAAAVGAGMDTMAGRTGAAMGGDTGVMAPGTAAGTSAMLSDPSTGPQIDSVVTAARAGLTSLAPSVAVPLIQRLEDKLDNSNDPALTDIAKDLEKLREELADDTVDGPDVASILERLGPKVTNAAGNAGAAAGTLRELGQQLTQAATQLRGGR
jgi:hypothetical protein